MFVYMELGVVGTARLVGAGRDGLVSLVRGVGTNCIPVIARSSLHASEDAWTGGVRQPGITSWHGRRGNKRTDADRKKDGPFSVDSSGVGTRQVLNRRARNVPERQEGEPRWEERQRAYSSIVVAWPGSNRWTQGTASIRGGFVAAERSVCCWRRVEAKATVRRSGGDDGVGGKRTWFADPLAVQEPAALRCTPRVSIVATWAVDCMLVFQPFAVQQAALPPGGSIPSDGAKTTAPAAAARGLTQGAATTSSATCLRRGNRKSTFSERKCLR
ncbi:unnamed protein product [Trichogramma brassicae]|uniref:Uncharacterized protein n=1 Tax=Trichogramma brassicae TaxID=86971 RepID=A0A6H5I315_9HYME|nr:unnamed protein product [Trichogramma brassicae]